jgi:hypothetical protein
MSARGGGVFDYVLLVRARAYQVTVQFPKEVVRSDRRARAVARCMVNLAVILCDLIFCQIPGPTSIVSYYS